MRGAGAYEPVGEHPPRRLRRCLPARCTSDACCWGSVLAAVVLAALADAAGLTRPYLTTPWTNALGWSPYACSTWAPTRTPLEGLARGRPGPAVPAWPGDGAFWDALPCARSEYVVDLPANGSAAAAAAAACGATVVTAWFDIGRSSWATYARPTQQYLDNMRLVMSVRNPMVVFTTAEFAGPIQAMRAAAGMLDVTTTVVLSSLRCSPVAHLEHQVAGVMCDPAYLEEARHPETPERTQPWYNLLMWAKPAFVQLAARMPHTAAPYYVWLGE
jgi:hypothetical protein